MPLFTSHRERRFWIYALIALAGIYSTLGIVRPMASLLRDHGMLSAVFVMGMLLVGFAVIAFAFKYHHNRTTIGLIFGILAVYLMVLVRIEIPEERTHIIEYGVVAIFIHQALMERAAVKGHSWVYTLMALLLTCVAGVLDELIQKLLPDRIFDWRDILFNLLAGAMAIGSVSVLRWGSSRIRKKTPG